MDITQVEAEARASFTTPETLASLLATEGIKPAVRARISEDPRGFLADKGLAGYPDNLEFRVLENTSDTLYLVFPPDPNLMLMDEELGALAGGKTASSAGTASTAGTASSFMACVSSASSASSAGSAGSAS